MRRFVAILAMGLVTASAVFSVGSTQAADESVIRLDAALNVVTWNGAAPYPIADFSDTPVTRIHRWDAATQEWLSRFPGQDGGTLPELHLLPRVQYLLFAMAEYELDVPDPNAEIDPHAELRVPGPADDPLRFEAWWPNEDSPLEDLILLRSDDERLSVKAEVAGGIGEIEVYWVLDGRLNHRGLASDDVELLVGKHDDARLSAVDRTGQAVVVTLPRVVKLPPLELPEMVYGVTAHLPRGSVLFAPDIERWYAWAVIDAALGMIAEAGLELVRFGLSWKWWERSPGQIDQGHTERYDRLFRTLTEHGLDAMPIIYNGIPEWASGCDVSRYAHDWAACEGRPALDVSEVQRHGRMAASLFPYIRYWQVGNEPNLDSFWSGMNAEIYVDHLKAIALGIWYENPAAIIIAAGICCAGGISGAGHVEGVEFVEHIYAAGFGPYHDVNAIHYPHWYQQADFLDRYLAVMRRYGDGDRPVWSTEMGRPYESDSLRQARLIAEELEWLTSRPEVQGAFIYNFRSDSETPYSGLVRREYSDGFTPKASYWAVREFLIGQPKPD